MLDGLYKSTQWKLKGYIAGRTTVGVLDTNDYDWTGFWPSSKGSWQMLDETSEIVIPLELC